MSSHFGSSHFGSSHNASSHYGRQEAPVPPVIPEQLPGHRQWEDRYLEQARREDEEILALIMAFLEVMDD